MTTAALRLFEYAAEHVTVEDVSQFCPNDPGYLDYVRKFQSILTLRAVPNAFDFDISETIGLTLWGKPDQEWQGEDALRFRRFRIFTNAVGLAIILGPDEDGWNMGCNYYAISLLDDIAALEDDHLHDVLLPVLREMHQKLSQTGSEEEAVFYLLAQLFLALMGYAPNINLNELADQLITEEGKLDADDNDRQGFLWQRTFFDQLHHQWRAHAEKLFPSSSAQDSLSRLRHRLLNQEQLPFSNEFPDFWFGSLIVGHFLTESPPNNDGRYRYEPYRGSGHYQLQESLKKGPGQRCHYRKGKLTFYFSVLSCPEHGILELIEFETPVVDPKKKRGPDQFL